MFDKSPIGDVETLYKEVKKIASWLRSNGHVESGSELEESLLYGSTGLEITGQIRNVLRKILVHDFKNGEIVRKIERCINYINYIWDDPVRDDNP